MRLPSEPPEPVLTAEDRRRWDSWCRAALTHARTELHRRRVDRAQAIVERFAGTVQRPYVGWSGGKDSTALTHLVCVLCGHRGWHVLSIKDDLDFPGEEEYVRGLAEQWGLERLDVVHPPFSLQGWLEERKDRLRLMQDMHGRGAKLARCGFYAVIDEYVQRTQADGCLLGLRSEESPGRNKNRVVHGPIYTCKDGITKATPIVDWKGIDVYAYLLSHDIEPLHVYRCIGLFERQDVLRKSWWIMGTSSAAGWVRWLNMYYPSLYRRLCGLFPEASLVR